MADAFEQTTIRAPLLGHVTDQLNKGHIVCAHTHQLACELVALLSAYREEDRRLYPEVYLLVSDEDDIFRVLVPGVQPLQIGELPIEKSDVESESRRIARTALKSCASLAIDGWAMYIRRNRTGFCYGLFRPAAQTYSVGSAALLPQSGLPAAILRNSAENTVEIVNSTGTRLEISLTTATPSKQALSGQIAAFASSACIDVVTDERDQAAGYLTRILSDFLRLSHGALIAVAPAGTPIDRSQFPDGVVFEPPIPLVKIMLDAVKEQSASADAQLRSHESLLRGMIMTDGITILGTDGSIKGFRVFVQPLAAEAGESRTGGAGGARSRAFGFLKGIIGKPLVSALFRSQDGRTEIVVKK